MYIYTIRVELFGKKEEEGEYIYNPFRFKWGGGSFPVDLLKFRSPPSSLTPVSLALSEAE